MSLMRKGRLFPVDIKIANEAVLMLRVCPISRVDRSDINILVNAKVDAEKDDDFDQTSYENGNAELKSDGNEAYTHQPGNIEGEEDDDLDQASGGDGDIEVDPESDDDDVFPHQFNETSIPAFGSGMRRWPRSTFHSTVVIEHGSNCIQVSGTVFDASTTVTVINPRVVKETEMITMRGALDDTTLGNDSSIRCNESVNLTLWIAGVCNTVAAFVKDTAKNELLVLGSDSLHAFRCRMKLGSVTRSRPRVMVDNGVTGLRRLQYIVEPDAPGTIATMKLMSRDDGIRWSQDHGRRKRQDDKDQHLCGYRRGCHSLSSAGSFYQITRISQQAQLDDDRRGCQTMTEE